MARASPTVEPSRPSTRVSLGLEFHPCSLDAIILGRIVLLELGRSRRHAESQLGPQVRRPGLLRPLVHTVGIRLAEGSSHLGRPHREQNLHIVRRPIVIECAASIVSHCGIRGLMFFAHILTGWERRVEAELDHQFPRELRGWQAIHRIDFLCRHFALQSRGVDCGCDLRCGGRPRGCGFRAFHCESTLLPRRRQVERIAK